MPKHGMTPRVVALALSAVASPALAQIPEGYFKGKTVQINIAGTAGGGIDIGARLVARYMGKYLPGNPQVIAQNMPGAGGVRVLDYLFTQAPRDGTTLGAFASGPLLDPLIGARKAAYGIDAFTAVGALERDGAFCTTWFKSSIKTLDDAKRQTVTVAGTGAGSGTDIEPMILNEAIGTKFKVITGYLGTQETALALERGEVDGRCGFGFASIKASKPDWLKENKLNFLVQNGLEKHPLAMDVPWSLELADTPDKKAMVRLISSPLVISRPYLAPPGLPPERAAEIRRAFMRVMVDPAFIDDFMVSAGGDKPSPTDGEAMQAVLASMQATPKPVVERMRAILNP
jgi:tripartite-type tricarboxylate transporter receptor subunit TctC